MEWLKENSIIKLDTKITQAMEQRGGKLVCQSDIVLFYEGHVPIVIYLLKSGVIEVGQGKKKLFQLKPGETLGLHEFYQKCPSLVWARAIKGSEVVYIDKSTLNELVTEGPEKIQELLCQVLE